MFKTRVYHEEKMRKYNNNARIYTQEKKELLEFRGKIFY